LNFSHFAQFTPIKTRMRSRLKPPTPSTRRASVPPLDPQRFAPSKERPLRAKLRHLEADTDVQPHQHPWAQVAFSSTGVIRMRAGHSIYLVPPSRALWIPPGMEHAVTVVEAADLRTLYVYQDAQLIGPGVSPSDAAAWSLCRVLEASSLLRELVAHLPNDADVKVPRAPDEREASLSLLILDELRRAKPIALALNLPTDKRLRALCEAVIDAPALWVTLDNSAHLAAASPRTVARLFRTELNTTFGQWRQQVLLAHALVLAAQRQPMALIASHLGYASASAFSAMVKRAVGMAPSRFFGQ
jgi:AraC-like DNA-binding protein